jgi:hypothetical protein
MIMPYYAVPKGLTSGPSACRPSQRRSSPTCSETELGYDGVINSDTGISTKPVCVGESV